MARKTTESRKIEMVPLIDVIFLLLIFFLVTLNIIPVISRKETLEAQYAMPVVTAKDAARVDMLIQLHQIRKSSRVHYFVIGWRTQARRLRRFLHFCQRRTKVDHVSASL